MRRSARSRYVLPVLIALACLGAALVAGGQQPVADSRFEWELAFVRDGDIWVANAEGDTQSMLVPGGRAPQWSPDGTRLAFLRAGEAWVAAISGEEELRQVSRTGGAAVDVSWRSNDALFVTRESQYRLRYEWRPSGPPMRLYEGLHETELAEDEFEFDIALRDIIVFRLTGGPGRIWLGTVRTSFQQQQRPFSGGQYVGHYGSPVVSPDGKTVAFIKDGDIWSVGNVGIERQPEIAFPQRIAAIAVVSMPAVVGTDAFASARHLDWAPDSQWVVCDLKSDTTSYLSQIWLIEADGSKRRRLATLGDAGGGICQWPTVSPDGKQVAFQSGGKGWEVWTVDLETGAMRRLLENAEEPDWRTPAPRR